MNEKTAVQAIATKDDLFDVDLFDDAQNVNKSKRENALSRLGIVGVMEDEKKARTVAEELRMRLEDLLGIETLYFEKIYLTEQMILVPPHSYFRNKESGDSYKLPHAPARIHFRSGFTELHDNQNLQWDRRSVSDYVRDGNGFPNRIINLLERLQKCGLPLGVSPTVWTPTLLLEQQATPADPMLVLELSDQLVIGLMRWNPTL